MRRNHRLRIGVYNQHAADQLVLSESPVEYLMVGASCVLMFVVVSPHFTHTHSPTHIAQI